MSNSQSRSLLLVLPALSIVGLLSMHGLDPVIATIDAPRASHSAEAGSEHSIHDVLGICLFIALGAGLALAGLDRGRREARSPRSLGRTLQLERDKAEGGPGPPRVHRLCVLRL